MPITDLIIGPNHYLSDIHVRKQTIIIILVYLVTVGVVVTCTCVVVKQIIIHNTNVLYSVFH